MEGGFTPVVSRERLEEAVRGSVLINDGSDDGGGGSGGGVQMGWGIENLFGGGAAARGGAARGANAAGGANAANGNVNKNKNDKSTESVDKARDKSWWERHMEARSSGLNVAYPGDLRVVCSATLFGTKEGSGKSMELWKGFMDMFFHSTMHLPFVYYWVNVDACEILARWAPAALMRHATLQRILEEVKGPMPGSSSSHLRTDLATSAVLFDAWMNGYIIEKKDLGDDKAFSVELIRMNTAEADAQPVTYENQNKGQDARAMPLVHKGLTHGERQSMIHMCMGYVLNRDRTQNKIPLYMSVEALAKSLVDTLPGVLEEDRGDRESRIITAICDDDMFTLSVSEELLNQHVDIVPALHKEALALDAYYARIVKGAAVNVAMKLIWVPDDEDEHSRLDKDSYQKIMWDVMGKVFQGVEKDNAMLLKGDVVYNTAIQMREIKRALTDVWEEAKNFRISNEIHMIEISVLERLSRDGVFHWLHQAGIQDHRMRVCFMMRRSPRLRYAFASVVGKRFLSERIISANRVQIIEHHRTVSWAEREYMALVQLIQQNTGFIDTLLKGIKPAVDIDQNTEKATKLLGLVDRAEKALSRGRTNQSLFLCKGIFEECMRDGQRGHLKEADLIGAIGIEPMRKHRSNLIGWIVKARDAWRELQDQLYGLRDSQTRKLQGEGDIEDEIGRADRHIESLKRSLDRLAKHVKDHLDIESDPQEIRYLVDHGTDIIRRIRFEETSKRALEGVKAAIANVKDSIKKFEDRRENKYFDEFSNCIASALRACEQDSGPVGGTDKQLVAMEKLRELIQGMDWSANSASGGSVIERVREIEAAAKDVTDQVKKAKRGDKKTEFWATVRKNIYDVANRVNDNGTGTAYISSELEGISNMVRRKGRVAHQKDMILGTKQLREALEVAMKMIGKDPMLKEDVLESLPEELLVKVDGVVERLTESSLCAKWMMAAGANVGAIMEDLFGAGGIEGLNARDAEILKDYFLGSWWRGAFSVMDKLPGIRGILEKVLKDSESSVLYFDYVNITRKDDNTTRERAERARKTARLTNTVQKTARN